VQEVPVVEPKVSSLPSLHFTIGHFLEQPYCGRK